MIAKRWLSFVAVCTLMLFAWSAQTTELILLRITEIHQNRTPGGLQLVVTMDYPACRYNYRGLHIEQVASGQGHARIQVRALATAKNDAEACHAPSEPRTDSLLMMGASEDHYDFVPVQPK